MITRDTKRLVCFFLMLALVLVSCGKSAAAKWQEQYDLGLRYLSEGNYEEAVIAFNAAIEIDPKQPAAYLGLADAYVALGDTEAAADALRRGLEAAGEDQTLLDRLAELESGGPEDPDGENPDSQDTDNQDPSGEAGRNAYGATEFTAREDYRAFDSLSADEQAAVEAAANAVLAQDADALVRGMELAQLADFYVYTMWNEYKVQVSYSTSYTPFEGVAYKYCTIELRPESGTGYYLERTSTAPADGAAEVGHSYGDIDIVTACPCADWQWNGTMEQTVVRSEWARSDDGTVREKPGHSTDSGEVVNSLREGTFHETGQTWYGDIDTTIVYQGGFITSFNGEPPMEEDAKHIYSVPYGAFMDPSVYPQVLDMLYW